MVHLAYKESQTDGWFLVVSTKRAVCFSVLLLCPLCHLLSLSVSRSLVCEAKRFMALGRKVLTVPRHA
jgi:hypothetical protein